MKSCYLGIDATDFGLELGIVTDDLVFHRSLCDLTIAEHFIAELESLLEQAKVELTQIKAIGVCLGPGSYTGIRTSIAFAEGLALGLNIRVVGVSSFLSRLVFAKTKDTQKVNLVQLSANEKELFVAAYLLLAKDQEILGNFPLVLENNDRDKYFELCQPFVWPKSTPLPSFLQIVAETKISLPVEFQDPQATVIFNADRCYLELSPGICVARSAQLLLSQETPSVSDIFEQFRALKPIYIKPVNAKTIAERLIQKDI